MKRLLYIAILFLPWQAWAWEPLKVETRPKYPILEAPMKFIVKDARGLVWLANEEGLMATDGHDVGPLHPSPVGITALALVDTVLWAGTVDGRIEVFDPVSRQWIHGFTVADSSSIRFIRHLDDAVVIGTTGEGLVSVSPHDTIHIKTSDGLRDNTVHAAVRFRGAVYIATDRGLSRWKPAENRVEPWGPTLLATALGVVDSALYAGTVQSGPFRLDTRIQGLKAYMPERDLPHITSFRAVEGGFVAASSRGVDFYPTGDRPRRDAMTLYAGPTAGFVVSDDGVVLILSPRGELISVDMRFAKFPARWTNGRITAIASGDSLLYVADSTGVSIASRHNPSDFLHVELPEHPVVVTMMPTATGVYVGTFNQGVFHLDPRGNITETVSREQGLPDNNVLSMAFYNDSLWVATLSGLSVRAGGSDTFRYLKNLPFGHTYIYALHGTPSALLIGTDGRGAYRYRNGRFLPLDLPGKNANGTVYQFADDRQGNVWINFKDNGLSVYRGSDGAVRTFGDFPKDEGYYMLAAGTDDGSALAIGDHWLCIIDQGGVKLSDRPENFPALSGEYLGNVAHSDDGAVFFASGRYLYRYTAEGKYTEVPRLILRGMRANLAEVSLGRHRFEADENHIVFSWSALWYRSPEDIRVRYRLLGKEEEWSYTQEKELIFPSLSPGSYQLEIQAGIGNTFFDSHGIEYGFTIAKPIYLRTWFLVAMVAVFVCLTVVGMRMREAKLNRINTEELRKVETELTVLRNQVNPHFLFNSFNTLMNMIEAEPLRAGDYLQRLSDYYRKILAERQYTEMTLSQELENLKAYFDLQKFRFGEALELHVAVDSGARTSVLPAMTLQLLAENAVKHNIISRQSPLKLKVFTDERYVVVQNGRAPKTTPPKGAGIGLENIRGRYRAMYRRDILVEKKIETFTVKLPLVHV